MNIKCWLGFHDFVKVGELIETNSMVFSESVEITELKKCCKCGRENISMEWAKAIATEIKVGESDAHK